MDTLYIGDIPSEYKYAVFSNGYITLYNKPYGHDETLDYFRIYTNCDGFYYSQGSQNFGSYNTTYFTEINVSNNWKYRTDLSDIYTVVFFTVICFVYGLNIITSFFKKGGVLGGLL